MTQQKLQQFQKKLDRLKRKLPAPDSSVGLWILALTPLALGIIAAVTGINFLHTLAIILAFVYFHFDGRKQGVEEYRKSLYKLSEYRKGIVAAKASRKAVYGTLKSLGNDKEDAAVTVYKFMVEDYLDSNPSPYSKQAYKRLIDKWIARSRENKTRTAD